MLRTRLGSGHPPLLLSLGRIPEGFDFLVVGAGFAGSVIAERAEKRGPILTSEDAVVARVGRELFQKFFEGYTAMFERMPAHPDITVRLGTDYRDVKHAVSHKHQTGQQHE